MKCCDRLVISVRAIRQILSAYNFTSFNTRSYITSTFHLMMITISGALTFDFVVYSKHIKLFCRDSRMILIRVSSALHIVHVIHDNDYHVYNI